MFAEVAEQSIRMDRAGHAAFDQLQSVWCFHGFVGVHYTRLSPRENLQGEWHKTSSGKPFLCFPFNRYTLRLDVPVTGNTAKCDLRHRGGRTPARDWCC
jgi:hypothetical protein